MPDPTQPVDFEFNPAPPAPVAAPVATGVPVLNLDKHHDFVYGLPGVRYIQDGHFFSGPGEYVSPEEAAELERPSQQEKQTTLDAKKEALREAFKEEIQRGTTLQPAPKPTVPEANSDSPVVNAPQAAGPDDVTAQEIRDLHWTHLRQRVQKAGGTYTGKQDAIDFLINQLTK